MLNNITHIYIYVFLYIHIIYIHIYSYVYISNIPKVSDKAEDEAAAGYLHTIHPGISGK